MNAVPENLHKDAFGCHFDPESPRCIEDSMNDENLDYQPPSEPLIGKEKLNEQINALNSLISVYVSKRKVLYKLITSCQIETHKFSKIHYKIGDIVDSIE